MREKLSNRILGIDFARALAMIGMIMVHVGPAQNTTLLHTLYALPHGRASILFAVVAGVGMRLLARSRQQTAQARIVLLLRALVLFPFGLWLQQLDHNVFVILQSYALFYIAGALLLTVEDRWLWRLAAMIALAGPVLVLFDPHTKRFVTHDPIVVGLEIPPIEMVAGLLRDGPYPLLTWLAPLAVGMALGGLSLRNPLLQRRMIVIGAVVAIGAHVLAVVLQSALGDPFAPGVNRLGIDVLLSSEAHSQTLFWLVSAIGCAVMLLGLSLNVDTMVNGHAASAHRGKRYIGRMLLWPLAAFGQCALSIYAGHLLLLHGWYFQIASQEVVVAARHALLLVAVGMVAAVAWRAVYAYGPLEFVLRIVSRFPFDPQRARERG